MKEKLLTDAELGAAVRRLYELGGGYLRVMETGTGAAVTLGNTWKLKEAATLDDAIRAAVRAMEERGDG